MVLPCQICQFGSSFANSWNFDWILYFFQFADVSHVTVMCDSVLSSFVFRIDIFTTQITVKVEKIERIDLNLPL